MFLKFPGYFCQGAVSFLRRSVFLSSCGSLSPLLCVCVDVDVCGCHILPSGKMWGNHWKIRFSELTSLGNRKSTGLEESGWRKENETKKRKTEN